MLTTIIWHLHKDSWSATVIKPTCSSSELACTILKLNSDTITDTVYRIITHNKQGILETRLFLTAANSKYSSSILKIFNRCLSNPTPFTGRFLTSKSASLLVYLQRSISFNHHNIQSRLQWVSYIHLMTEPFSYFSSLLCFMFNYELHWPDKYWDLWALSIVFTLVPEQLNQRDMQAELIHTLFYPLTILLIRNLSCYKPAPLLQVLNILFLMRLWRLYTYRLVLYCITEWRRIFLSLLLSARLYEMPASLAML